MKDFGNFLYILFIS